MAWHCLTHTTGRLAIGVEAQTAERQLQRIWALVALSRRGFTKAIRPMVSAGDMRRTAESAAQRLPTSGWWPPINRDECDATARPQALSHAHSGVLTRRIVPVAGWLRSPLQRTPRYSPDRYSPERSRPSRTPTRQRRELQALASPEGLRVIRSRTLLPE